MVCEEGESMDCVKLVERESYVTRHIAAELYHTAYLVTSYIYQSVAYIINQCQEPINNLLF